MEEFFDTDEIFRELEELGVELRRDSVASVYSNSSQQSEWKDYWAWLVKINIYFLSCV